MDKIMLSLIDGITKPMTGFHDGLALELILCRWAFYFNVTARI